MPYSAATYYLDLESGVDTARASLTSVTVANNGSGLVRCTKTAHGLVTGAVGTASLNYAGDWKITVIDANNFDLIASTYSTATALTFTPFGGSSKADAWKTITSGATAARIAPGDTIRVMASPDETLVGNATWTINSKLVTLAGSVTANISTCESNWTPSVNVTAALDSSKVKEGANSIQLAIAGAFTMGKVAYFATGTLDLSSYQQVSFMLNTDALVAASTLSLRLCSDTAGVTTVHTIAIPQILHTNSLPWTPIVVDLGANMNSAIASVALYADLDPGTITVQLDNIIACKAASSADSLTHASLIGKVWNLCWIAASTYAANDIRKPTQPNRNGFRYKVTAGDGGAAGSSEPTWPQEVGATVTDGALTWTCEGLEDTYYAVQSINGTAINIEYITAGSATAGRGYSGITETVAMYKRECLRQTMQSTASVTTVNTVQDSGTDGSPIRFTGGWSRTDMTTMTGETWVTGQNGYGYGLNTNLLNFLTFNNLNSVRMGTGMLIDGISTVTNCHHNHGSTAGFVRSSTVPLRMRGVVCNNGAGISGAMYLTGGNVHATALTANGTIGIGIALSASPSRLNYVVAKNNSVCGIVSANGFTPVVSISNLTTASNSSSGLNTNYGVSQGADFFLNNSSLTDSIPFSAMTAYCDRYIFSHKHNQTADNHLITTDGGTIISATDQRHTASGISWKFRPTSTNRNSNYPLRLSIAKIACLANTTLQIFIWTRRDNTNINGTLKVAGGQLSGIPADVSVACAPTINTWVQSGTLTVTPTEAGVIEVTFEVYDGVGTINNFWVDDLSVA